MAKLSLNNVTLAQEIDGVAHIDSATAFPAGHVINVYTNKYGSQIDNTTQDWTDLQVGITLTPVSLNSKFFIYIYSHLSNTTSSAHGFGLLFKRDATFINYSPHDGSSSTPVDGSGYKPWDYYKDETRFFHPFNRFTVDSPNTINQITYSAWAKGYDSTSQGTLVINRGGMTDTEFIIMEFA